MRGDNGEGKQPWRLATSGEIEQAITLALDELVGRIEHPTAKLAAEMAVKDMREQIETIIKLVNNGKET